MDFRRISEQWPTRAAFVADAGVPYDRARKWLTRGYIPGEYWLRLTTGARKRGLGVTVEMLAMAAEASKLGA